MPNVSKRIMFYSHDTFGLGHIRRTQKIANAISSDYRSILIACSSPMATSFASEPGVEYLSLPGIAKQMNGEYLPRAMNLPIDDFICLRANLLLAAVSKFQPDVLIIDKEPLGVKRELVPSLKFIKENLKDTTVICGFRDILDDAAAVKEEFKKKGIVEGLEAYFQKIFVYGDERNFDFVSEYDLPESLREKIFYTGYVQPPLPNAETKFPLSFPEERPLITFTLGGGGDGWSFLETMLAMLEKNLTGDKANYVLLTGPFANIDLVNRAKKLQASRSDLRVIGFTSEAVSLFKSSNLVVSMGGYNTVCELLHLRKPTLILPRIVPRQEQLIRAQVLSAKGYCDYIHPIALSPNTLADKLLEILGRGVTESPELPSNGIATIKKFIDETLNKCEQKLDSSSKVIPA
jgi:predicted glycosyltransferase